MDSDLIYTKTASGENAIQQRSRILQRNTRMVLILVDGHSSVEDLGRKIGNTELVEEALSELEEGGFIVRQDPDAPGDSQIEPQDFPSVPETNRVVAEQVERAEKEEARREKTPRPADHEAGDTPLPQLSDESEVLADLPLIYDKKEVELSPRFSPPPRTRSAEPRKEPAPDSFLGSVAPDEILNVDRMGDARAPAQKPKTGQAKNLVRLFVGLAFILFLGFQLFPFGIFIPDVENAFSSAIGAQVKVLGLRVNAYPTAELILSGVKIGQGKDEIEIREIRLQPELTSWFSRRKVFRKAIIAGTNFQLERVASMPAIFSSLTNSASSPKIGYLQFADTNIHFHGFALKGADAEVQMDMTGTMQALEVRSEDRNLTLKITPETGGRIDLAVEAFAWRPHAESAFLADAITLKARLEKDLLSISDFKLRLFDGLIQGNAIILAGNAKPNVSGTLSSDSVNVFKLGEAMGIGRRMAGNITGKMRFTANSETWPEIFSLLKGDGEFTILRGSIYGADLAEAVRQISRTPVQGGVTTFEQMNGKMRLGQEKNQFYELNIASGLMQSTGYVDIVRGGALTGRLDILMRGTLVPVVVSGSSSAPAVQAIERPPG